MAARLRRADDVAMVGDEQRYAILDLAHLDRPPVVLEGTGAMIWHLLGERPTHGELLERLAELYDVSADAVADQVEAFLRDLRALDLVQDDA